MKNKNLIRCKEVRYNGFLKDLVASIPMFEQEVGSILNRFHNLDFGLLPQRELIENTEHLASESGMLIGRYFSTFGECYLVHNLDFGNTVVTLDFQCPKQSHYGF